MEKVSKDDLPGHASTVLDRIANGAEVSDELVRFEKDGETVYCAKVSREDQEDVKVFLSEDGTVEMTKQETSILSGDRSFCVIPPTGCHNFIHWRMTTAAPSFP